MIFDNGYITAEALKVFEEHADMIPCECPTHLMEILAKVRDFQAYTNECITKYPADEKTHIWLLKSAKNIDALLSSTIVQLARMEGFIDEKNQFVARESKSQS